MKLILVVLSCMVAGALAQGCGEGQWTCADGLCVPESYVCDGEMDCIDGSDEADDLNCAEIPCDGFRCNDTAECIPGNWVCDNYDDCRDGSDEIGCVCDGFQCPNGNCLPPSWICDGDNDCGDGTDEKECPCDNEEDFKCEADGHCIPPEFVCDPDGVTDCSDGSDEANCGRSAKQQKKLTKMQALFIKNTRPSAAQLSQKHNKIASRYGKH